MIQLDVLFNDLGDFGAAQVAVVLMMGYYGLVSGINFLATIFIAYEPDHRCRVPPIDNLTLHPNWTESEILQMTSPYNDETDSFDQCSRYGFKLDECQGNNVTCINTSYPAIPCDRGRHFDGALFSETVITEFDLVCGREYLKTLSTSLFYAGVMLGSIAFGNFSDLFGRWTCTLVSFIGVLSCMLGVALSSSIVVYILFRFFLAFFSYGTTIGTYVYIMEIVGARWRSAIGIGYQMFFAIRYMIFGGIAYKWRNWHEMMVNKKPKKM